MLVTDEDRALIRQGLLFVSRGVQRLVLSEPETGSVAAALLDRTEPPMANVEAIGTLTLSGISLAMQASSAHIAAFVDGVVRKRMTVTLAPVARAGIEAAANADYVLSAEGPDQMVQRHLQLSLEQMRYPAKFGKFTTGEGTRLEGAELQAGLRAMLADSGTLRDEDRLPTMSVRVLGCWVSAAPPNPISIRSCRPSLTVPRLRWACSSTGTPGPSWCTSSFRSTPATCGRRR